MTHLKHHWRSFSNQYRSKYGWTSWAWTRQDSSIRGKSETTKKKQNTLPKCFPVSFDIWILNVSIRSRLPRPWRPFEDWKKTNFWSSIQILVELLIEASWDLNWSTLKMFGVTTYIQVRILTIISLCFLTCKGTELAVILSQLAILNCWLIKCWINPEQQDSGPSAPKHMLALFETAAIITWQSQFWIHKNFPQLKEL